MPVNGPVANENVVSVYSGILFSSKKKEYPASCDNMDEIVRHYVK